VQDDELARRLGPAAFRILSQWEAQQHLRHTFVRAFDNGATDAKVMVVDRHDERNNTAVRLVLKLDRFTGTDFGTTEYARHAQAIHDSGSWAKQHLAHLVDSPIPVGDGWWLVFQSVAGNLDQFTLLGNLVRELSDENAEPSCTSAVLVEFFVAIVTGVLADWAGPPSVTYLSVPKFLEAHFGYRLAEGKPLQRMAGSSSEPTLALLRDRSLTDGVELTVPVGIGHGDLHFDNAMVRIRPSAVPDDFRLFDLAKREAAGPLGRDPAHLLMHMINGALQHLALSALGPLRRVLLDPEHAQRDRLPAWLRDIITRTYEAAEQWIEPYGYGPDWRLQRPLSLYAATLMVYVRDATRPEDRPWLKALADEAAETFLATVKPGSRTKPATPTAPAARRPTPQQPRPNRPAERFVVGRQAETGMFAELVEGRTDQRLLNVYGPGGIGKTEVLRKFGANAERRGLRFGTADLAECEERPSTVLRQLCLTLIAHETDDALLDVLRLLEQHDTMREIVLASGGVDAMFDAVGAPTNRAAVQATVDHSAVVLTPDLRAALDNRFSLQRFLRSSDRDVTSAFGDAFAAVQDGAPSAVLLDTYEEAGKLDTWVRQHLLPVVPDRTRIVVFGRNQLAKQNFDWSDHDDAILSYPLPELGEDDAKSYLRHYGLTDAAALDKVYRFTGGYPLVLVLVRKLAKEAGGWHAVGEFDHIADRDKVAGQLLDRILREEQVHAVREVIEKCAIASWINPEVIRHLLDVTKEEARRLYTLVEVHSFVSRHPEGVRLHDKIRELLIDRLRFTSETDYQRLRQRLLAYHASKTIGVKPADG